MRCKYQWRRSAMPTGGHDAIDCTHGGVPYAQCIGPDNCEHKEEI